MDHVHLSVCMSLDGHIDAVGDRLVLSSEEDCRDMHALRAASDAILVGAGTVRRDAPRLTVRYPELVEGRRAQGLPDQPAKVALTRSGDLDPASPFFQEGGRKLVLCPEGTVPALRRRLGGAAPVLGLVEPGPAAILAALSGVGVRSLLVEGGMAVLTQFLAVGAFHRLRLAIAPFFVGQAAAPRMAGPAAFLHGPANRLRIEGTRVLGNVAVMDLVNDAPRLG